MTTTVSNFFHGGFGSNAKTDHENSFDTFFEDEKLIRTSLENFKAAIKQIDNFSCPMEDDYLLRFLRTKKFNIDETIRLLERYFKLKIQNDHMSSIRVSGYKPIYDTQIHMVLKHRDSRGRKIMFVRSKYWDPNEFNIDTLNMATFFILHEMTSDPVTQRNGCIFILDNSGVTFRQARAMVSNFTPSQINKMIVFQGSYPVRFKGIHSFNAPFIFEATFNVAKYMLKKKLRNRLHVHRTGFSNLHKYFSPDILPEYLGGTLTEEEAEDHELMASLYAKEDYYHDHWKYGYRN